MQEDDLLRELGTLAVASRLKRLSDKMMHDVASLYKSTGVDFSGSWLPIFHLLKNGNSYSIVEIAKQIRVSHPTVNQLTNEMLSKGIIISEKDSSDRRKRYLRISPKGKELIAHLQILWEEIAKYMKELLKDKQEFLTIIGQIEDKLEEDSIERIVKERLKDKFPPPKYKL